MKNIHTAPLEVLAERPNGAFASEPHEAGWADEAIAMIYVRQVPQPGAKLVVRAQISLDGARWMDHPAAPLAITGPGAYSLPLVHFGNWLRLSGEISGGPPGGAPAFVYDFYWVLKG